MKNVTNFFIAQFVLSPLLTTISYLTTPHIYPHKVAMVIIINNLIMSQITVYQAKGAMVY